MYQHDDILIIGDSFCSHRDSKDSWPQLVLTHLTGVAFDPNVQPRGKGFRGGAWWSCRKLLLKELQIKVPKVLIMCHTEPFRIPNDSDYSLNFVSVENKTLHVDKTNTAMPEKLAKAAEMYYEQLISFEFHLWANQQWFKELDELCQHYDIEKVLHLYCFEGEYSDYTFKRGTTISVPLFSYAEKAKKYFWNFKSKEINHFSGQGNMLFAQRAAELISNFPGDNVRLEIKMVNYESS